MSNNASEGHTQGPYAAAWGRFEPATLRLQGTEYTPLRWIRTRNPPAAKHRIYLYTTAPLDEYDDNGADDNDAGDEYDDHRPRVN